jgi:hypothetical protein
LRLGLRFRVITPASERYRSGLIRLLSKQSA